MALASSDPRLEHLDELNVTTDPVESAKEAGLRYVHDGGPGIRRRKVGKHFSYIGTDGQPVHDEKTVARIKSLAIPPAWTDVWICPLANGHLQATGRDARGRKQYRYHPRWREVRDETKYERMIAFAEALPVIRERVDHDISLPTLSREKVLATVVRLLETTLIRVGNEEYARENKSYGLTTMRKQSHVDVEGSTLRFHFTGKSGVKHEVDLKDKRVARVIKRLKDLPGQHLFKYVDEDGELREVESGDVNDYLREITGQEFSAKDFRTWAGTVMAAEALRQFEAFDSETQAKKNIVRAIESVAERLGNTPSVARSSYVHPAVLEVYLDGQTLQTIRQRAEEEMKEGFDDLDREEAAVLALLRQRLADQTEQLKTA